MSVFCSLVGLLATFVTHFRDLVAQRSRLVANLSRAHVATIFITKRLRTVKTYMRTTSRLEPFNTVLFSPKCKRTKSSDIFFAFMLSDSELGLSVYYLLFGRKKRFCLRRGRETISCNVRQQRQ